VGVRVLSAYRVFLAGFLCLYELRSLWFHWQELYFPAILGAVSLGGPEVATSADYGSAAILCSVFRRSALPLGVRPVSLRNSRCGPVYAILVAMDSPSLSRI
jgi:hypothetical protein